MESPIDKRELFAALKARAEKDLDVATQAQRATVRGATHEESKPENDKDTRALEASYLARGQAARVEQLREALQLLDALDASSSGVGAPIRGGSLVQLEEESGTSLCVVAPVSSGLELVVSGHTVVVVSTRAPLGRALLGRRAGDSVEVPTPRGPREIEIGAVW